jgi:invasion protein IalB
MRTQLTRIGVVLVVLIVGLIIGWIGGVSVAHDGTAKIAAYKDWHLVCPADDDKKSACALQTDVVDSGSGSRVAQITIAYKADKPDTREMVMTVPLAVLIQPGLGIQFGTDAPKTVPFGTCIQTGCIAMVDMDDKLTDSMRGATAMSLVVTAENGKSIPVPVSVQGFDAALSAMNASEARRHSWWRRLWS